jgi:hypothetical protein
MLGEQAQRENERGTFDEFPVSTNFGHAKGQRAYKQLYRAISVKAHDWGFTWTALE